MVLENTAPYLRVSATKQENSVVDADTGAGYRRVNSFSIFERIQSTPDVQKKVSVIDSPIEEDIEPVIVPDWRPQKRVRTISVGLVLALNFGFDPPGVIKPSPCAVLECWIDPTNLSTHRAKEMIGEQLRQQYAKWQLSNAAKLVTYQHALDPTIEDVRLLCYNLRKQAKDDRILIHYNGHGAPRVSSEGEIWVFDKTRKGEVTDYIPLSYKDLRLWMGKPSILVLDCSSAGTLVPFWLTTQTEGTPDSTTRGGPPEEPEETRWAKDTILLCACSDNEWLPMQPGYPADIFTCCLTTPIPIALRWFVHQNRATMGNLDPDAVECVPGDEKDRTTPLGELNRIFIAITDSIAWDVLPKPFFQLLFRQDMLFASMFRNFLLADRIMRSLGCTPVSYPPLPSGICDHPLWHSWDLACENLLFQVNEEGHFKRYMESKRGANEDRSSESVVKQPAVESTNIYLPFFTEQLTAFEVWLDFSPIHRANLRKGVLRAPEQLPILLQVLLWPLHRIRALKLLQRFHDLGPWAVNLALISGIFPYIGKLLQNPDYTSLLVSIWASILAFDSSCRVELLKLKDGGFGAFTKHMLVGMDKTSEERISLVRERILSTFVVTLSCHAYPTGQLECVRTSVHRSCNAMLSNYEQKEIDTLSVAELEFPSDWRVWLCLAIASMAKDNPAVQSELFLSGSHERLIFRLKDKDPHVRAAACYALGCLIWSTPRESRPPSSQDLMGTINQTHNIQNPFTPNSSITPPNLQFANPPTLAWQSSTQPALPQVISVVNPPVLPSSQQRASIPQGGRLTVPALFPSGRNVISSLEPQLTQASRPLRPSVYDDRRRLEFDLVAAEAACEAGMDASLMVRYESIVTLGRIVGKYQEAFLVAAEDVAQQEHGSRNTITTYPAPKGLDPVFRPRFCFLWKHLRMCQHKDPCPMVKSAASMTVSVVHEELLKHRFHRKAHLDGQDDDEDLALNIEDLTARLNGLEDVGSDVLNTSENEQGIPRSAVKLRPKSNIRRVATDVAALSGKGTDLGQHSVGWDKDSSLKYTLPTSSFYDWKKKSLDLESEPIESIKDLETDPLSPVGATKIYLEARNMTVREAGSSLAESYFSLIPKPETNNFTTLDEESAKEAKRKRDEVKMKETVILTNANVEMTKMVRFHSYEDVLVACGANDSVSVFSSETGKRHSTFLNGNPRNTRLTSSVWLNEETENSLFLVGCNDGSVRLWGEFLDPDGRPSSKTPTMVSSFFASSVKPSPNPSDTSGLVCEWQPSHHMLICGGSSDKISFWDLETEKLVTEIDTETQADVTTLTTAWDFDQLGMGPSSTSSGYSGIGPDVLVSGHSDGTIKIFDIRLPGYAADDGSARRRRRRVSQYNEHKRWVVSTTFTAYGNRHLLLSGTLDSEIKAWDLRMSTSIRTIDAQRSMITACAVHTKMPLVATGSEHQYIKLLTLDGKTIQVLRYHEKKSSGHRIGPVSCLAFHRYKPILAAGSTDEYIGIYTSQKYA